MKQVRCAIYTRKSSDEGLDQAFNSLDAQREACAAYILSQASEGWTAMSDIYDDGGLSGGTLERPALQRLLADVVEGRVDIIVIYKLDRLTRSLLDFAKLVETLDKAGTSFVSITQSFNTTTSMGRLTLNMLLSFAQFEREVTAERIRDKIAASKAKGMWMGGTPPLGYAPDGRSLKIIDDHAALIRDIYERYLALGNVRLVAEVLAREGIRTPQRVMISTGRAFGGVPFGRGQIYSILKCATYVGEVHHHGKVYPGLHPSLVDRDTWDRVQAKLASNVKGERSGERAAASSPLAGKIVDEAGDPLSPVHATKGRVRYRYYVSRELQHGRSSQGMRIPAREIETAVAKRVAGMFDDGLELAVTAGLSLDASDVGRVVARSKLVAATAMARDRDLIRDVVARVRVRAGRIEIECSTVAIASRLGVICELEAPPTIIITSDIQLTRSGRAMRLIQSNGASVETLPNASLVKLLIKARRWWAELRGGELDITRLSARENVPAGYMTRVVRLAFLAPAVVDAILQSTVLPSVGYKTLIETDVVAGNWDEQVKAMLPR